MNAEERKEYQREWRIKNRKHIQEERIKYRENNRERLTDGLVEHAQNARVLQLVQQAEHVVICRERHNFRDEKKQKQKNHESDHEN